jgi:hypothetical protein
MRIETKWAAILAIALFAWLILEKLFGLHNSQNFNIWLFIDGVFSLLLFILVYFMVTKEKRDRDLGGVMTWSEGFWTAIIMTLISIPLSTLLVFIIGRHVSPEFPGIFSEKVFSGMVHKDSLSSFLFIHVLLSLIAGLLGSVVFPLIIKKQ